MLPTELSGQSILVTLLQSIKAKESGSRGTSNVPHSGTYPFNSVKKTLVRQKTKHVVLAAVACENVRG